MFMKLMGINTDMRVEQEEAVEVVVVAINSKREEDQRKESSEMRLRT